MSDSNLHHIPELGICLSETPFSNAQVTVSYAMREILGLFQENCLLVCSGRTFKGTFKVATWIFCPSSDRVELAKSDTMVFVFIQFFSYPEWKR